MLQHLRRQPKYVLAAALVGTMTATSYQVFVLAVLASDLIAEFGLSRAGLGLIGSVNTMLGALSAPWTGRLTDRIGAKRAAVAAVGISAVGTGVMAAAPNLWVLSLSAIILALPQGWGNPATNALIAERVPAGQRGTVTGIKQSGVQFGIFLSGLTLPTLALLIGWRGAIWGYAAVFACFGLWIWFALGPAEAGAGAGALDALGPEPSAERAPEGAGASAEADRWIWRLATYALLAGTVGGTVGRFFPLWAEEVVGLTTARAGLLVALGGLIGMAARVAAGRLAERSIEPARLLSILAVIGAIYCVSLAVTTRVGPWILWPSTVLNAVGIGAWNAVAMLAVITAVPSQRAGRASGIVMLGFLTGLSVGAPIAGLVVDRYGTYQPLWWVGVCLLLAAARLSSRGRPEAA